MKWRSITVAATPDSIDELERLLWAGGAVSVTAQDGGDEPLLEPGPSETPLWRDMVVTGLFEEDVDIGGLDERLRAARFEVLQVDELTDRAWEREWLGRFKPVRFGQRLWVCPTAYEAPPGAQVVMWLDPGLAFGTGTHPTTRLCLEWLDANLAPGQTVVDYGCGSGILGIAALLLGAAAVAAVDNDPQALAATRTNARGNGVDARLSVCAPDDLAAENCDVVIANILAQPLIDLAARLQGLLAPGGRLVLSGILRNQADRVRRAYPGIVFAEDSLDNWICLDGRLK